ncbi:unannotated protein [freshwater metagenome]|uniref:Unannotated protein n=1 Tax=freshwater metagenome TaxID=449393 RepID=A0A6J7HX79_9ZZZZ
MWLEEVRIERINNRGLDGGTEDSFGVMQDVCVERIIATNENRKCGLAFTPRATGLLP